MQLEMSFHRDLDERSLVMMLDNLNRDRNDGRTARTGTLQNCQLDSANSRLTFLSL